MHNILSIFRCSSDASSDPLYNIVHSLSGHEYANLDGDRGTAKSVCVFTQVRRAYSKWQMSLGLAVNYRAIMIAMAKDVGCDTFEINTIYC